jgi:hypothetical protein
VIWKSETQMFTLIWCHSSLVCVYDRVNIATKSLGYLKLYRFYAFQRYSAAFFASRINFLMLFKATDLCTADWFLIATWRLFLALLFSNLSKSLENRCLQDTLNSRSVRGWKDLC